MARGDIDRRFFQDIARAGSMIVCVIASVLLEQARPRGWEWETGRV